MDVFAWDSLDLMLMIVERDNNTTGARRDGPCMSQVVLFAISGNRHKKKVRVFV